MASVDAVLKSRDLFFVGHWAHDPALRPAEGLFARDTRYLNRVEVAVDGHGLVPRSVDGADLHVAKLSLDGTGDEAVEVTATISIDSELGLAYTVRSRASAPLEVELSLRFSADFRDVFELRGWPSGYRGLYLPPVLDTDKFVLRYRARDGHVLTTAIELGPDPILALGPAWPDAEEEALAGFDVAAAHTTGAIVRYKVDLQPGSARSVNIRVRPEPERSEPSHIRVTADQAPHRPRATVITDNADFNPLLARSTDDLDALLTRFPDGEFPAAGIPWFVAPFGRDSLIVAWQTLHLDPGRATETLRVLARLQGRKSEPVTGEQPGKIIHEARYGELARLEVVPHRPYYGSVDATSLFLLVAAETVAWTGDTSLYAALRSEIEAALRWIEEFGDLDGDGLIEYRLEADPANLPHLTARHQSWKDSDDSLHHPDGHEPTGNIAPVEAQGYTYAAYLRLAEVARRVGDTGLAALLESKAESLRHCVNKAFWIESEGYYAQALDGKNRQVGAISSNAGQLLFTGIVPPARARAVVDRMSEPDMDSGWGIRTLSSRMASYDGASYHNGSVWPHDNSLIADGCYRTGHVAMGTRLFEAMFEAGRASSDGRLSELYCGSGRHESAPDAPVPYPSACSPQAWASGVYPSLIRSALGLRVDLSDSVLIVAPALPTFLGSVEIENLEVLGSSGSLAVRRHHDRVVVESADLPVRVRPSGPPV